MVRTKKATKSKTRKSTSKTRSRKPAASKSASAAAKSRSAGVAEEAPKAMRLTFSYDGDKVKLISQQAVDMMVPPSDPVKGYQKQKGFWAELKSVQDKTLYRHVMHNPTRNDAEVFSDDRDQSISREPAPKRKGLFVIVVPDIDKGHAVTLSRSSPEKKGPARGLLSLASKPATEIARFTLKK